MARAFDSSENVYELKAVPPTKGDSDDKGFVLYFKPGHGWFSGYWQKPYLEGVTHWTYLPECPPVLPDPDIARDQEFDKWVRSFPDKLNEGAIALMRLGWNAGWKRAI